MYDSRPKNRPPEDSLGRPIRSGEAHPCARLTRRQVLQIRAQADRARLTRRSRRGRGRPSPHGYPPKFILHLAAAFGVSANTIYDILSRRKWRNV